MPMEAQTWTPSTMGRSGARKRWGPRRRHNVADLDAVRRERVEAFIEAERRAQERESTNEKSPA